MLMTVFFLSCSFFFHLESDEDIFDDKSHDDGSAAGFTSSSFFSLFLKLFVDSVSELSCNEVTPSKTSQVSSS